MLWISIVAEEPVCATGISPALAIAKLRCDGASGTSSAVVSSAILAATMDSIAHISSVAQVIQLAVAPVFLLAGVGTTLNVFASRIGRIIDRARTLEERLGAASTDAAIDIHKRLAVLSRRARLVNRAIGFSVFSGVLVSLVVVALFVSAALKWDLGVPIAFVFVGALLSLTTALLFFLREVFIATETLRFGGARSS